MRNLLSARILSGIGWWSIALACLPLVARGAAGPVHGMWVWKTATVLEPAGGAEALRDFCTANGISEIYVSMSNKERGSQEGRVASLIELLHRANMHVEALLDSTDADEPGKPREKFLEHVRDIVRFNQKHSSSRFDGIHLDVEPHQREENKGAGNLKFMANLTETFRTVRMIAEADRMTVNADVTTKMLKGDAQERRMLLTSVPRVTLMMYELSSPGDGKSAQSKAEKARKLSGKYLEMAYAGLDDVQLARMAIALRTPDYLELLPDMLKTLDEANQSDVHYLGWARHSYNDAVKVLQ